MGRFLTLVLALVLGGVVLFVPRERVVAGTASAVPPGPSAADRLAPWMRPLRPGETPPQFVVLSFDGAASHVHWRRIMDIAERTQASVTGFLSGVYLLDSASKARYRGPGHAAGASSIGFGGPAAQVDRLVADLGAAVARGHEIGTHYNGHFCRGAEPSVGHWTTAMWGSELDQFGAFVDAARAQRGLRLDPATIRGGRTPCLEGDPDLFLPALRARGFTYDSSLTSNGIVWPYDRGGVREFPMPVVTVPALGRRTILMDYNLWFALNRARDEPGRVAEFTGAALGTFRAAYQAAFAQNRAPLVVGNHFNEWSGGAFSAAVEGFMAETCLRPETVCTTYSQVMRWLDLQDPAVLAPWRARPAAQV